MSVPTHTTPPPPIPQEVRDWVPATRTLLVGGSMVQPRGETWDVFAARRWAEAARPAAWAALSGAERGAYIHRFADALEAAADRLLPSIVNEVGTPVSLAEYLQVKMAVQEHLRWAADAAATDRTVHLGRHETP